MINLFRKNKIVRFRTPDPRSFPSSSCIRSGITYGPQIAQIGRSETGAPLLLEVAAQPHVLIAGASGSGKSSLMHAIILSLAAVAGNTRPRFGFIDVKRVEFATYKKSMFPMALWDHPACDIREIRDRLADISDLIERRYSDMEKRNITAWNGSVVYLVIDELADLVIGHRDILQELIHICQIGRAAGVHVIAATQVPSRSTIPTLLQVNMPCHIALRVSSPIESRIIIGDASATTLRNPGDMICCYADGKRIRGHADYYTRSDVSRILETMKL
jgi:S-DNA-T family DNA segregation ATPase FtsK/SpoIIIE